MPRSLSAACCGSTPSRSCSSSPPPSSTRPRPSSPAATCTWQTALRDAATRRRFYAGLNLFCWSMVAAPLVNGLALLWVAIEITTVISALLVAIDDTDGATEASWKYVLIASLGLGHRAARHDHHVLRRNAPSSARPTTCPTPSSSPAPHISRPMSCVSPSSWPCSGSARRWAWSRSTRGCPTPTPRRRRPVSALLSGALLATSFYAILRYFQIAVRTLGPTFPRNVLLIFGLASLLLAALYLLSQRDLKRLLGLLERRAHGNLGDRHELRRTHRCRRGAPPRAGPRGREGHGLLRGGIGRAQVRAPRT